MDTKKAVQSINDTERAEAISQQFQNWLRESLGGVADQIAQAEGRTGPLSGDALIQKVLKGLSEDLVRNPDRSSREVGS